MSSITHLSHSLSVYQSVCLAVSPFCCSLFLSLSLFRSVCLPASLVSLSLSLSFFQFICQSFFIFLSLSFVYTLLCLLIVFAVFLSDPGLAFVPIHTHAHTQIISSAHFPLLCVLCVWKLLRFPALPPPAKPRLVRNRRLVPALSNPPHTQPKHI